MALMVIHLSDGSQHASPRAQVVMTVDGPKRVCDLKEGDLVRVKGTMRSADFVGDRLPIYRRVLVVRNQGGLACRRGS